MKNWQMRVSLTSLRAQAGQGMCVFAKGSWLKVEDIAWKGGQIPECNLVVDISVKVKRGHKGEGCDHTSHRCSSLKPHR